MFEYERYMPTIKGILPTYLKMKINPDLLSSLNPNQLSPTYPVQGFQVENTYGFQVEQRSNYRDCLRSILNSKHHSSWEYAHRGNSLQFLGMSGTLFCFPAFGPSYFAGFGDLESQKEIFLPLSQLLLWLEDNAPGVQNWNVK